MTRNEHVRLSEDQRAKLEEKSQVSQSKAEQQKPDLRGCYRQIGIPAVQAAVRFQGQGRKKDH